MKLRSSNLIESNCVHIITENPIKGLVGRFALNLLQFSLLILFTYAQFVGYLNPGFTEIFKIEEKGLKLISVTDIGLVWVPVVGYTLLWFNFLFLIKLLNFKESEYLFNTFQSFFRTDFKNQNSKIRFGEEVIMGFILGILVAGVIFIITSVTMGVIGLFLWSFIPALIWGIVGGSTFGLILGMITGIVTAHLTILIKNSPKEETESQIENC
jgi:uncharacterized membrane protein